MRTPLLLSLLLAGGALIGAAPIAAAASSKPVSAERPAITESSPLGYYIWRDKGGVHLRTHGPGTEHDFVARLRSKGTFEGVDGARLEQDDRVTLVNGDHGLDLHFHTYGATDGVDFSVQGADVVRFNLDLDRQPIPTDAIYLGAKERHPAHNPFTVRLRERRGERSEQGKRLEHELSVAAKVMQLTPAQLKAMLPGKLLDDVAASRNVPPATVAAAIVADLNSRIDQLVSRDRLTAQRAEQLKAKFPDRVSKLMAHVFTANVPKPASAS